MHTKRKTQGNMLRLIQALREEPNVSRAARAIGISRTLAYGWKRESEEKGKLSVTLETGEDMPFHEAWAEAIAESVDELKSVARRLATGYEEPVIHQGQRSFTLDPETFEEVPLTVTKYETRMLEILLKAHDPENFRERHDHKHSGEVRSGVLVVPGIMDRDAWERAALEQRRRDDENDRKGRG